MGAPREIVTCSETGVHYETQNTTTPFPTYENRGASSAPSPIL